MNALVPMTGYQVPSFTMDDVERVAMAIARGGLFGSKDPNAVLTLCLLAQAEGKHPALVMQDYHVINGKPAKKAEAMLRDFISAGGKIEWHKLDNGQADATFSHPGGGTVRIEWTVARAKQAGISTPMWSKYPRQMLRSRVISEGVRTVYPGATSGLYEVGEVQDIVAERSPTEAEKQIAATVEHEAEPERAKPVKLDGPYTSKSKLWAAVRAYDRELRSCGDTDQLDALMTTDDAKALMEQVERDAPQLAHGGEGLPEEFEPIHQLTARLHSELALEEANA